MSRNRNWSVLRSRLKTAVKKLKFVMKYITESIWRLASVCGVSRRRSWSFNDRYIGLRQCVYGDRSSSSGSSGGYDKAIRRTSSTVNYYSFSDEDDVDKTAEIFIANFQRRLLYERQVSLELRYGGLKNYSFH